MDKIIQKAIDAITSEKYERALGILETALEMIKDGSTVEYSRKTSEKPLVETFTRDLSETKKPEEVHPAKAPGIQEEVVRSVVLDGEKIDIVKVPVQKRNILPPGMMGMMLAPDHPQFESHGAKERKYV